MLVDGRGLGETRHSTLDTPDPQIVQRSTSYLLASWHRWVYQRGIRLFTNSRPGVPMSPWLLDYMGGTKPVRSVR